MFGVSGGSQRRRPTLGPWQRNRAPGEVTGTRTAPSSWTTAVGWRWCSASPSPCSSSRWSAPFVSGSLALLADAGHMLTDVAGLTLAYVAAVLARRPATDSRTWGYRRAEVLAAAGQAAVLLAVGGFVIVEGVRRLIDPPEVAAAAMIVFGVVGLAGNLRRPSPCWPAPGATT